MTAREGQDIRKSLETLAEVSRDLDRHTQLSKTATHPIQAQQVRKRIDELTKQQTSLMNGLVEQHPKPETKKKFESLTTELDQLRLDIRACEDKNELADLEDKIEDLVNRWVHQFQVIVSELTGIKPPTKPVFDS
jgi:excinuclease UvrABC helicase subunit UvrB